MSEFRCENGQCIDDKLRCDAKPDCVDATDEKHCGMMKSEKCSLMTKTYPCNI